MTNLRNKRYNFLLTRLQNIGDALVFIPTLRALRETFPAARITVLTKHSGGIEIIKNCPYVDDIITVRNRTFVEKIRLIKEFRKREIDFFIISPQDLGRVPWALLGGAKNIAGFRRIKNYNKIRKEKLPFLLDISPIYDINKTEIENCLNLIADVIDKIIPDNNFSFSKKLEFWYNNEDKTAAIELLNSFGISEQNKYVVSAPFSKREAKNWQPERFVKIFKQIIEEKKYKVVLLGGNAEKNKITGLIESIGQNCISLAGQTSLGQCAYIIERADLFIGPDSGPAFIATAMNTPAIVLYSAADYYRWRIAESNVPRIEIFHPFKCNPCKYQVCPKKERCIDAIQTDEVMKYVCKLI